jgi:hypothetical protein
MFDPIRRLQRSSTLALALSPVGIILIAAIRLLIVSDYKLSTATAIVTSDGYVNTLLGTLLPVVPLFIPFLGMVLLFTRRFLVGLLALAAAVLISPTIYSRAKSRRLATTDFHQVWEWLLSNRYIFVLIAAAVALLLWSAALGVSAMVRTLGVLLAVAMTPVVLQLYPLPIGTTYYTQLLRQPWLPEERIALHDRPTVLGYMLADTNVSMEVLVQANRSVAFYPNAMIAGQQICQATGSAASPLAPLTQTRDNPPPCVPSARGLSWGGGDDLPPGRVRTVIPTE